MRHSDQSRGRQQETVRKLFSKYDEKTYLALVCGKIGVCLLQYREYLALIYENFIQQEIISVAITKHGRFRVQGPKGQLKKAILMKRFPEAIFEDYE